jgi:hypothetical protein
MGKNRFGRFSIMAAALIVALSACGGDVKLENEADPQAVNIVVTDSVAPVNDRQVPFGSVQQGASSDQTITIANQGTADLVISTIASANSLTAPFSISADTCSGQTIAPAGSCTLTVRFAPTGTGSFTDNFDIPSDDPGAPTITVSIIGTGTAAPVPDISVIDSVNPNDDHQVPFGDVVQGNTSDQTVTVTNNGTTGLVVGTVASANPLASPFSITIDNCSGQTIAPSGTCTMTVRFGPTGTGSFTDSFDIPSNDPDISTVALSVSGTGTAASAPNIVVTDSVNPNNDLQAPFGSIAQGNTSDQTITVTNSGNADLVIGTIASVNPLAAPFSIFADTCFGQTIVPSGTCAVTVRFAPTGAGSFTDSFDIPSNDPDTASVAVSLTGTGTSSSVPNIAITDSVAPADDLQIAFGGVVLGSSADQTVTVMNSGNADLLISTVASANTLSAPFSITVDTCSGQTLIPAATCSLTVNFSPAATTGFYTDSFDIPSNDPDSPSLTISVKGIGLPGAVPAQMGGSIQGNQLVLTNNVTTFAGLSLLGWADGIGIGAKFFNPSAVVTDGVNIYVADTAGQVIRQIVIATGAVTTIAGLGGYAGYPDGTGSAARFYSPQGITSDGTNLYVADTNSHTIRKVVIATGEVTSLAGSHLNIGSADGIGSAASFCYPAGITTDGTNLYVADTNNNMIRKIEIATATVTTIAGAAINGSTDGTGTAARFKNPWSIATDGTNLYVADKDNSTIRKIVISTGAVTTFAGLAGAQGTTDGTGTAARFRVPRGITSDGTNLYVTDTGSHTIRKIVIATAAVSTVAGTAGTFNDTDGIGTAASFYLPYGLTTDGTNVYVADTYNHTIREIALGTSVVSTLAGAMGSEGTVDAVGTASRFDHPYAMTSDGTNIFIADNDTNVIRKIVISTGAVTTLAGSSGLTGSTNGTGSAARFNRPRGITTDGANLYVTDYYGCTIRKIVIATGAVTTFAGTANAVGSTDGIGSAARFNLPSGITTDGANLYVSDTNNHKIRRIVIATREVTTIAGATINGSTDGVGTAARFNMPHGLTTDGTNVYVADSYNYRVRKIVISTGEVTTLAGSSVGSLDGTGTAAKFGLLYGITTDGTNLYVADSSNDKIRKIVISSGVVTSIAGLVAIGSADGTGSAARFNNPAGITTDGVSLYISDSLNNSIRKIQ